jgi:hypothetical protein
VRLLHAFAFSKNLPWFEPTNVIPLKMQPHAENAVQSCVATSILRMRLLHVVAFSKKFCWLTQTKEITLKTQPHAVNACVKRSSQGSLID